VVDEYGDPVEGVPVEALPVAEDAGKTHLYTPLNSMSGNNTDDRAANSAFVAHQASIA
jgi:hypothetical protein